MKILNRVLSFGEGVPVIKDLSLLFFRLILAYGFWSPAIMKWQGLAGTAGWFESMGYPVPMVSAILAAITEILGVFLLTLGLGSRLIAVPLIFVMLIAIFTVHISNGFAAGENGFEIPFYYILMLLGLVAFGSGRFSIDYLLRKK
jgi:putative oxidoreductase